MSDSTLNIYPILLAGGSGTRLWPISREFYPKQLVRFFENTSLIQQSIQRLLPIFHSDNIRIVCGQNHAQEILRDVESLPIVSKDIIIDEPCGRNTAPAILLAVLKILTVEQDAVIFVFPADHMIGDLPEFHKKINEAYSLAVKDYIVTFGITPTYPETGYGYIEASETKAGNSFLIKRFVEKPDLLTAAKYLKAGNYFWNSGMFAFKASTMLKEFKRLKPGIFKQISEMVRQDDCRLLPEQYEKVENISIDYAIMESTDKGVVLPSNFIWSDIGSWKSLYDFLPKDNNENVIISGDVILQNTRKTLVMGHERFIAVNGLENLVVVETPDSVFVSDMQNSRDVKYIVDKLKEKKRKECEIHTTVNQPWGYFKTLEENCNTTIKRIVVNPGSEIPKQQNNTEDKQWVVLEGSGTGNIDKKAIELHVSDSIRIGKDSFYSLQNPGKEVLSLIEITKSII